MELPPPSCASNSARWRGNGRFEHSCVSNVSAPSFMIAFHVHTLGAFSSTERTDSVGGVNKLNTVSCHQSVHSNNASRIIRKGSCLLTKQKGVSAPLARSSIPGNGSIFHRTASATASAFGRNDTSSATPFVVTSNAGHMPVDNSFSTVSSPSITLGVTDSDLVSIDTVGKDPKSAPTGRGIRDGSRIQEQDSDQSSRGKGIVDMVTLGNLCVDVVVNVDKLPPIASKLKYVEALEMSPPHQKFWEAGGSANVLIAGGRLGLNCVALGHLGDDPFGEFFAQILEDEGVRICDLATEEFKALGDDDYGGETLAVWVLIDPNHEHAFASRFDFNSDPVFSRVQTLPEHCKPYIQEARALYVNGFTFDELPPRGVLSALQCAYAAGTAIFFDPGPRTGTLLRGKPEAQEALNELLRLCSVLLLTADEALVLTGQEEPMAAAQQLLSQINGSGHAEAGIGGRPQRKDCWVVVKRGEHGCVMATREDGCFALPGFRVNVADTVGCGDSFAAAMVLGYTRGATAFATLALANAVGAATAMGAGAGRNVARAEVVREILLELQASFDDHHEGDSISEALIHVLSETSSSSGRENGHLKADAEGGEQAEAFLKPDGSTSTPSLLNCRFEGDGRVESCLSAVPLQVSIRGALELLELSLKASPSTVR
eukprot:TRINITY_DN29553_c0_g1_i1.p1 TRINITY_DN29553_c0_g1~~TRINITY_DN29553_c0_g1_i1.p1  ORF type:complete len:658 (+),score=84.84 TRINITY_DN29553_c0_g1_i1:410-2383(+)